MDYLTPIIIANAGIQGLTAKLDLMLLAFAVGATVLSGMFFGLLPAWRVTRAGVSDVIKEQGSTSSASVSHVRFRKILVAGQVAFTMLLLAGATLFVRTLLNLRHQDLGLRAANVMSFSIFAGSERIRHPTNDCAHRSVACPHCCVPGCATVVPQKSCALTGNDEGTNITAEGSTSFRKISKTSITSQVSADYFSTLGSRSFRAANSRRLTALPVPKSLLRARRWSSVSSLAAIPLACISLSAGADKVRAGHRDRRRRKGRQAGSRQDRHAQSVRLHSLLAEARRLQHDVLCEFLARPSAVGPGTPKQSPRTRCQPASLRSEDSRAHRR